MTVWSVVGLGVTSSPPIGAHETINPSAPLAGHAPVPAGGVAGGPTPGSAAGALPAKSGDAGTAGVEPWMPPLKQLPHRPFQYRIELSVDEATGRVVAKVIDRESGEVIRQVPPEHVLQVALYIDELLGKLLDQWA